MIQKLVIGFMAVSIVLALGGGILDALNRGRSDEIPPILDAAALGITDSTDPVLVGNTEAAGTSVDPVSAAPQPVQQSQDSVGEPWSAFGVILELDDTGMFMQFEDGSEAYVELGQTTYWQSQGVSLASGDSVAIDGFFNGENYHARMVVTASGQQLILRTPEGQPMWSGGASGGQGEGSGAGQEAIAPEAWVTYAGIITQAANSEFLMQLETGSEMPFQLGQPAFWQTQGVTLAVGDEVSVLGYWQGERFTVAEVAKTLTGERIMLRDPNGRPLWAGPGRNGGGGTHTDSTAAQ